MKNIINKVSALHIRAGQYLSALLIAPSTKHQQLGLFAVGTFLLCFGMINFAQAQISFQGNDFGFNIGGGGGAGSLGNNLGRYNDTRIAEAVNRIFAYIEGAFGALVMVAAGLGAIVASAFGQYRAALGLLVVAVGAFILRSLVGTFFNDISIG